ncbi:hypothetical protein QYE76_036338 [Lolium multiflorum]|uniref:Pectinesterase inhibitor domain-containing protein n=1 Tax=Lolium multiflorum TaxID=4521 RepID=A0AAD8VPV6_LOLMU|nr:hypothetical protein QYE76_036338 [Lolium multiflorum]
MKIILILLLVLPPLCMAATHLQCRGVPHINTMNACRSACGTKFMYDLCINAMRSGGIDPSPLHTEEATVYAILAANQTSASYLDTLEAAGAEEAAALATAEEANSMARTLPWDSSLAKALKRRRRDEMSARRRARRSRFDDGAGPSGGQ